MNIYLAGVLTAGNWKTLSPWLEDGGAKHVNLLESFYNLPPSRYGDIGMFKRFMLDSGAFTLAISRKGSLSNDELTAYVSRYAKFVAEHDIGLYFEMDIDHVKGTEWVKRTTDWLERETGVVPIPVWHPCRKAKGFEEMCERYPYVAIGTTDIRKQLAKSVGWFTSTAHRYGSKIHGLGYTKLEGLAQTGFDSVDSTAWLFSNKSATIYNFDGRTMTKEKLPPGKRLIIKNNLLHSLVEWTKFSDYMEAK